MTEVTLESLDKKLDGMRREIANVRFELGSFRDHVTLAGIQQTLRENVKHSLDQQIDERRELARAQEALQELRGRTDKRQITPGELEAIRHDLNRVMQQQHELAARVDLLEKRVDDRLENLLTLDKFMALEERVVTLERTVRNAEERYERNERNMRQLWEEWQRNPLLKP